MSSAFVERGHNVTTVDNDPSFAPSICADVQHFSTTEHYDVVLTGPPCEHFSLPVVGRNWTRRVTGKLTPRNDKAQQALTIVESVLRIVREVRPVVWVMENPRAILRKLPVVQGLETAYITQCQYGRNTQKPTDLWGTISLLVEHGFTIRTCKAGSDCHDSAPRGTRGERDSAKRSKVTYGLSLELCKTTERIYNERV